MIEFSKAQSSEATEIAQFVNSAYRGDSSKKGWTTEADILGGQRIDAAGIQEMLSEPDACIQLMRAEKGKLLGCVFLKIQSDFSCYLGMLTVLPEAQGQGWGKQLLEHAEHYALQQKCHQIKMTVITVREELIEFYERRGYHKTGIRTPFPSHDPRFGAPKVANLEFEELAKPLGEPLPRNKAANNNQTFKSV